MTTSQNRKGSALEAGGNILIGYGVAVLAQLAIFPLFSIYIDLSSNLLIGLLFTLVSFARSYMLRRFFNWLHTLGYFVA